MKKQRTFLFRIFFFLTILLSVGVNSYQNLTTWSHQSEIYSDKDVEEESLSSHIDNLTIDQIGQHLDYTRIESGPKVIPATYNFRVISQFSYPVWQPPKVV